ncbi:MAG TPA: hypothetical protein VET27_10185 [Mycobacterium sp.]|nr:hypothetical protein [Mycobacterium sp.]
MAPTHRTPSSGHPPIGIPDSRLAHLARAIRWIRARYEQPLRVADVAVIAAMSPSSFHRHFRA